MPVPAALSVTCPLSENVVEVGVGVGGVGVGLVVVLLPVQATANVRAERRSRV